MTNMEKIRLCQEIVDRIQQESSRPACYLEFSQEPFGITDSHLGGVPYVPRDGEIPTDEKGSQLWLCAQINFPAALLLALPGIKAKAAVGVKVGGEELEDPPVRETVQMGHLGKVDLGAQPQLIPLLVGGNLLVMGHIGHPAQVAVRHAKGLFAEPQIACGPLAILLNPTHNLLAKLNLFQIGHPYPLLSKIKTPLSL